MPKTSQASNTPELGRRAPAFTLPSSTGGRIRLSQFRGKKNVVLYFYPRDNTPGCTREACGFRDAMGQLNAQQTVVLGVSTDDIPSHQQFSEKYDLPFPLLSDPDAKVASKYGVWGEKTLYGRKFFGVQRSTFLIDKHGKIAALWPRVKVDTHAQEVLEAIRSLPKR